MLSFLEIWIISEYSNTLLPRELASSLSLAMYILVCFGIERLEMLFGSITAADRLAPAIQSTVALNPISLKQASKRLSCISWTTSFASSAVTKVRSSHLALA
jgi:hypothetical protein